MNSTNNNRNKRRCSFCTIIGHNIKNCNDLRIQNFDLQIKFEKNRLLIIYDDINMQKEKLEQWIFRQNIQTVKAYSIRHCDGKLSQNIMTLIQNIIDNVYSYNSEMSNTSDSDNSSNEELLIEELRNYLIQNTDIDNINVINELVQIIISNRKREKTPIKLKHKINSVTKKESKDLIECNICFENIDKLNLIEYNCKHNFCVHCVKKTIQTSEENQQDPCCALCREKINTLNLCKINRNKNCSAKDLLIEYIK